jgi:hypothetical protein
LHQSLVRIVRFHESLLIFGRSRSQAIWAIQVCHTFWLDFGINKLTKAWEEFSELLVGFVRKSFDQNSRFLQGSRVPQHDQVNPETTLLMSTIGQRFNARFPPSHCRIFALALRVQAHEIASPPIGLRLSVDGMASVSISGRSTDYLRL